MAHYLNGKKQLLNIMEPEYQVDRVDSDNMRRKIQRL